MKYVKPREWPVRESSAALLVWADELKAAVRHDDADAAQAALRMIASEGKAYLWEIDQQRRQAAPSKAPVAPRGG